MEQAFDTTHSTFTLCAARDKADCKRMSKRRDRRRTLALNGLAKGQAKTVKKPGC